ncbi:MAG: tRNA lysidine(34) synthetase TilS [Alphaproteobacteria bacterium]
MTKTTLAPDSARQRRFNVALNVLAPANSKLGLAVSGGPDSLALLLLAAAARPGKIEVATIDHGLRPESAKEAEMVAEICGKLGVPHTILKAEWKKKPETAIQERARIERYRLLGNWLKEKKLDALLTAHHLDDQAETMLMRLNRGSGARGLAGMRGVSPLPGSEARLLRPLLGWRRSELEEICKDAGLKPVEDPSNTDEKFERARVRKALGSADWLDPENIARSAAHLAQADVALHWATDREWESRVTRGDNEIVYRPEAPFEIRRRVVMRSLRELGREGRPGVIRGTEVDKLVNLLARGKKATLRGVLCSGGEEWRFTPAPPRKA